MDKRKGLIGASKKWGPTTRFFIFLTIISVVIGIYACNKGSSKTTQNRIESKIDKLPKKSEINILPELAFQLYNLPSKYISGLNINGIQWENDYKEYLFRVRNDSVEIDIYDVRLDIDVPGGVVKAIISHEVGCDTLRIAESNNFGGIAKKDGVVRKQITSLTNNLRIYAVRLFPESYFEIKVIVKLTPSLISEGYIGANFKYLDLNENWKKNENKFRILPIGNSKSSFKIDKNNPIVGKRKFSRAFIPLKPLIFKSNGKVISKE